MEGKNISELDRINQITGDGLFAYYSNGNTFKLTYQQILDKISSDLRFSALDDIGQIFISDRIDTPLGCLNYCNGAEYLSVSTLYPEFCTALVDGKIFYISYSDYDNYLQQSLLNGPCGAGGWCPFLAFDQAADKIKMPKMDSSQVATYLSTNRTVIYDGLPDITGTAELQGTYAISGTGLVQSGGGATAGAGGSTGAQSSQILNIKASRMSLGNNNPYGRSQEVHTKGRASVAYIVVSNNRFLLNNNNVDKSEFQTEIINRQQADLAINNRIDTLSNVVNNAKHTHYEPTYAELVAYADANKLVLKTGEILLCGGLSSNEEFRNFFWDSTSQTMIETTVRISLDGYVTETMLQNSLASKVNSREGYDLSKNDFSDTYKAKLDNSAWMSDVTDAKAVLEAEISNKVDKTSVKNNLDFSNPSQNNLLTEAAVASSVLISTSSKMEKQVTFNKDLNYSLQELDRLVGIENLCLDLSTFSSADVTEDCYWEAPQRILPGVGTLTSARLSWNNQDKSLSVSFSYTTDTPPSSSSQIITVSEYLVRFGAIVARDLTGGKYWRVGFKTEDGAFVSCPYFSISSSKLIMNKTEDTSASTPTITYNTVEDLNQAFDNMTDAQKMAAFNSTAVVQINSALLSTLSTASITDVDSLQKAVYPSLQALEQNMNTAKTLSLEFQFAWYTGLNGKIVKILSGNTDRLDFTLTDIGSSSGNIFVAESFPSVASMEYFWEHVVLADRTGVLAQKYAGYVFEVDNSSYYKVSPIDPSSTTIEFYRVQLGNLLPYKFIPTLVGKIKPDCDAGTYSELSTQDILDRIDSITNALTYRGTVDLVNSVLCYKISSSGGITIANGGTGYERGDRIKFVLNNQTENDKWSYGIVTSVGLNGVVSQIKIIEEGIYFQDVTQTDVNTINIDNPNASGLTVNVTSTSFTPTSLPTTDQITPNSVITVIVDSGNNYMTTQWVYTEVSGYTRLKTIGSPNEILYRRIYKAGTGIEISSDDVISVKPLVDNMVPSNKVDNLTFGPDGTIYVAPANGYFLAEMEYPNSFLSLSNISSGGLKNRSGLSDIHSLIMPAKKNDQVVLNRTTGTPNASNLKFIYSINN